MLGDEQSLADPDDILERFMAKQHHARFVIDLKPIFHFCTLFADF